MTLMGFELSPGRSFGLQGVILGCNLVSEMAIQDHHGDGYTSQDHTFTVSPADLPSDHVVLVADDSGEGSVRITACNEVHNELELAGLCTGTDGDLVGCASAGRQLWRGTPGPRPLLGDGIGSN
ncbi:MAG TPA: hypothetical protein DFR83_09845 [Deltaproteobacteria bacterium]|nr:hypothetical protein [Deltaproteobacteria bacterium]